MNVATNSTLRTDDVEALRGKASEIPNDLYGECLLLYKIACYCEEFLIILFFIFIAQTISKSIEMPFGNVSSKHI